MIKIWTDGSCKKDGRGGWAYAASEWEIGSGSAINTTNQRMELTAVIEACKAFDGKWLEVISDSAYVVNCFKDRWYLKWQQNGWRNSAGKNVANQDLWGELVPYFESGNVTMSWVKGHNGDPMNEFVDKLATGAVV